MKKMLMVATVPSMIGQFNMSNIYILLDMGYEVHVACNFHDRSIWSEDRIKNLINKLNDIGVRYHQIEFSRSPKDIGKIYKSLSQMGLLMNRFKFEFIHCHTPIASVISRICCHRSNVRVIYTVHGFHFYHGAPLKNWLLYYPVEKVLSKWTDILITINKEDYERAEKKFHPGKIAYVPGAGVDLEKFESDVIDSSEKRKELGIEPDDIMLLSVGELNNNKNHKVIIEALCRLKESEMEYVDHLHYFIAGKGEMQAKLIELAEEKRIKLHLLGFRNDVPELLKAADIFILPSFREGLNVSLMEAMACRIPVACSRIRGNTDLILEGKGGFLFDPKEKEEIEDKLERLIRMSKDELYNLGEYNFRTVQKFCSGVVERKMRNIYKSVSKKTNGV